MKWKFWLLLVLVLALSLTWCGAAAADDLFQDLTINGMTNDITLEFNEAPLVRVLVPDDATGLIVEAERISGDEPQHWCEVLDYYRISRCNELYPRFFDSGEWEVTARYTCDEYEEGTDLCEAELSWNTVGMLTVEVNDWMERLDEPYVMLSATTLTQGDWLQVTVGNFQDKNEWYWYDLARMDAGGEWDWFRHTDVNVKADLADSFCIPTIDLDPGDYRLWVRTEAVGYEDNGVYKTFTVTENNDLSDLLSLSASTAAVGVPVEIAMRAEGADWMSLTMTMDEDPFWNNRWETGGSVSCERLETDRPGTYRLTLTAWEGDSSRVVATATYTATTDSYLADPVYTGFPGVISAEQNFSGTITLDSRTERYYVELNYCPQDGEWISLFRTDREPVDPAAETLSLPEMLFAENGRYRLHVHAYAMGIESSYNEFWFFRYFDGPDSVTLKVNDSTGEITVPSNTDLNISVISPAATAVKVMIGDRWEYYGSPESFTFNTGCGSGDFVVLAQISTDTPFWNEENFDWGSFNWETDVEWCLCSNAVVVHARDTNGRLDPPAVTLESANVERGDWINATVTGQNHGEWYWAEIRRLWRNDYGDVGWDYAANCSVDASGNISYPSAVLEPGDYLLTVHANGAGWKGAEKSVPFTVTEGETDDLALYLRSDTILTSQDITFFAYAAGADFMCVDVTWDEDSNWHNYYYSGGESDNWNWSCSQSGVYTFTLSAWEGENSLGETSFTLTVTAPYGKLGAPSVEGLPGVLETESDIEALISFDESTQNIGFELNYCGDEGDWDNIFNDWRRADQDDAGEIFFPAESISRPGIYRLDIHTTAVGWNGSHLNLRFLVTDSLQQSLTLTVNHGSEEDIYLHQTVPLTVTGPEGVTAVRLWSSASDWWDRWAYDPNNPDWYWGFHQGGEETILVQATTDSSVTEWLNDPEHGDLWDFDWSQVSWTLTSGPVTVPVIYYGDLDDPEVSFPDGTTVERGELLRMLVSPVDNAYGFGVQVRRADDETWDLLIDMEFDFASGSTVLLPTDALEPGNYLVQIDPRKYGWQGNSKAYAFTVTEPASWTDEAVFRVFPSEIQTREYVTYSVYAPGAQEVIVCNGNMNARWADRWGESVTDRVMLSRAEVYSLKAYAYYLGDDENEGGWSLVGSAEVNVTAPNGAVELTVDAPSTKKTTDSWTVTLLCDFKGEDGETYCYLSNFTDDWYYELPLVSVEEVGDLLRFTYQVEANSLQVGPYLLTAYALPEETGYDMSLYEGFVEISDGTLEATLTVSPLTADIFEDLDVDLSVPGATAVGLFFDMDHSWHFEPGAALQDTLTAWEDGEWHIYGVYTTDEIDPEAQGFDWGDVNWEGMSNLVTVKVNPPVAELEELNVSLQSDTVKQGRRLILSILNENPGLDVSYGAHLQAVQPAEGDFGYPWFGPDPDGSTIRVDTLLVPPGEYLLVVSANARGCRPVMTSIPVTVTEGTLDTLFLPAGLRTIGEEAFANVAAERIVIPNGVTTIASNAFTDCPNLVELVLPEGITSFAPDALGSSGPVYVRGQAGSYVEAYADLVNNLVFVAID